MKKIVILIFIALMSCKEEILHEAVIIPVNTQFVFGDIKTDLNMATLKLAADTSADGITDIIVEISSQSLVDHLCFLRMRYPDKDIVLGPGTVHQINSVWTFNALGSYVKEERTLLKK